MKRKTLLLMAAAIALFACSKRLTDGPVKPSPETPDTVYTGSQARNLNIVYFIPSDLDTLSGYQKRMNEYLLYIRQFYKDEMHRNGYGNKTFGLQMNASNDVRITVVRGALPKSGYPRDGAGIISQEILSYFRTHPADSTSEHTLVLLPPYGYNADSSLQEGPYYGYGRWCFALDYEGMDMTHKGKPGKEGDRWTLYVGGLAHELGHAFNLPHDKQKVSEKSTIGTALMHLGNYTLGKVPTILTATDAAILNTVSVFNSGNQPYYGAVTANMQRIYGKYDAGKQAIVLSGKFSSNTPVNSVVFYNDPDMPGNDGDYDAITWECRSVGSDSFYIEMPVAELDTKSPDNPYELRVKFVHNNGTVTPFTYGYTFDAAGIPVLGFAYKNELSKQGWSIASFSSQQNTTTESAAQTLDGDPLTFWHSRWSSDPAVYPHELVVDMQASRSIRGISYTHRANAYRGAKDVEILYSTNGTSFISAGNFVVPKYSGPQYLNFTSEVSARYFKVICKSSWDGTQNAAIAELGAFDE